MDADRNAILADGEDLSFVTVSVRDNQGVLVPGACDEIEVDVEGGNLIGLCNGNPASHEAASSKRIKAFNGMLLAIIQSSVSGREIVVKAKSEKLEEAKVRINHLG
jgi:beta-galactosidase